MKKYFITNINNFNNKKYKRRNIFPKKKKNNSFIRFNI